MKKVIIASVIFAMVVGLGIAFADKPADGTTGNGAPKAKLLGKLNIIGVSNPKNANMDNAGGGVIFVPLNSPDAVGDVPKGTKIWLTAGDFAVLDKNGTDSDGAAFRLPNPDPGNTGSTSYSVYVRGLGKPGQEAKIKSGFLENGVWWVSVDAEEVTVTHKMEQNNKFVNVSRQLLYVWVDIDDDGDVERIPLFYGPTAREYFWNYDNNGQRLCQLRFYDTSSGPYEDPESGN